MIMHNRPSLDENEKSEVNMALESGWIAEGERTKKFEQMAAKTLNSEQGVAVSSGTAALHLSLLAAGIGKESRVAIPTYACTAILNVVNYVGAEPILIDNAQGSYCLDMDLLGETEAQAAIVQHSYGAKATIPSGVRNRLFVIEDCAQSFGHGGLGLAGHASISSFYATKMITTGNGGLVATSSREFAEKIHDLKKYDMPKEYHVRYNYQFGDIQAAVGLAQMKKLGGFIKRRKEIAKRYNETLERCSVVELSNEPGSVYYRYLIRVPNPQKVKKQFAENGIDTILPIEPGELLHRYLGKAGFPNAEKDAATTLSLPCYPALTEEEVNKVCKTMKAILR